MAGGTFIGQNKVRAGVYVNTFSKRPVPSSEGVQGITALPIAFDFGPEEIQTVDSSTNIEAIYGEGSNFLLGEALKGASTVLVGRVTKGVKASGTIAGITVTAKYSGSRGNDINIVVTANAEDPAKFDVMTLLDTLEVNLQTVTGASELVANNFVEFGSGTLTVGTGKLTGGTTVAPTASDYADFNAKLQLFDFNTVAYPVTDSAVTSAAINFVKRLREEEGKKCQAVIAGAGSDYEGVINIKNGVILEDGTVVPAHHATAWVAGASAGAGVAGSLTYSAYPGAVDVDTRYISSEIVSALRNGEFLFIEKRGTAVVEKDINSLVTLSNGKGAEFRKNRVLRVLDDIANSSKITFEDNYIGQVNNDENGRELFKADRIVYMTTLMGMGAITDFVPEDITVLPGQEIDTMVAEIGVKPIDAVEKIYITINVF